MSDNAEITWLVVNDTDAALARTPPEPAAEAGDGTATAHYTVNQP